MPLEGVDKLLTQGNVLQNVFDFSDSICDWIITLSKNYPDFLNEIYFNQQLWNIFPTLNDRHLREASENLTTT